MSLSRPPADVELERRVIPLHPGTPHAAKPATPVERPVLSVSEAAALLGVSEWLVLQQTRRGLLPHRRVGRRIVISRERLLSWINTVDSDRQTGAGAADFGLVDRGGR